MSTLCIHNAFSDVLKYVDPFIGTDEKGHCFPGATTPMGMIQLSPSNDSQEKRHYVGYHWTDTSIKGFAHTHFSGTGLSGMGDFLMMPLGGELKLVPGTEENPDLGYRARLDKTKQKASPGYYLVEFEDNQVLVELTASARVGFHRYTFQNDGEQHVIFDPTHRVFGHTRKSEIEILSDTELRAHKHEYGHSTGLRDVYFYVRFNKPFQAYGVTKDGEIVEGKKKITARAAGAFITFQGKAGDVIEATASISHVNHEGAKANHDSEAIGIDFDEAHQAARTVWQNQISRIQIEGTLDQKRIFYSGMYRSFIAPNIISDVNGNYMFGGKRRHHPMPNDPMQKLNSPGLVQLSNISSWDTYRALHPLWTIIDQKSDAHLVNVLVSRHTDTDSGIGLWEALGFDNACMPGYSSISIMVDAAMKELPGVDPELVYQAVRQAAKADVVSSPHYGKDNGVDDYNRLGGWMPATVGCSVTKTTENNYYDWCVAQLAGKLGYTLDEKYFRNRSLGYRELFNAEQNFLWPKYEDGTWETIDLTHWGDKKTGLISDYVSGNIWAYSGYTPHDMEGAIELWGGKEKYAAWLDEVFTTEIHMAGDQHFDISGFIGGYGHGDEPGHQMPYNYIFAGQPWKAQELVHEIMTTMYFNNPTGYINNEDCGQMSAWYIFSSLGFYPVAPGDLRYYIGSPLHPAATINLESGKTFKVIAKNHAPANIYIESATLNGQPLKVPYIEHAAIMNGGILEFTMSDTPNKNWGTQVDFRATVDQ
ncbi:MAG: GH92 family glycosyl hydrolase [Opitutales bacterium]